jgi:DNA-binding IclR family transcriptional regulator
MEALAETPRTPSELAVLIGIDRSSALRLLRQLSSTGYVVQGPRSKRYGTDGARFLQLVSYTPDHTDLSELVDPILRAARARHGEAALLAVPARGSMVYAAFFPSRQMLGVREQLGAIRPMHCSAVGKAYLSAMGDDAMEGELERLSYEGGTARAAADRAALYRHLLEARRLGYAVDRGETSLDVSCVAVPLRIGNTLMGAIGVTGPSSRLPDALLSRVGRDLIAATASIRTMVGRAP